MSITVLDNVKWVRSGNPPKALFCRYTVPELGRISGARVLGGYKCRRRSRDRQVVSHREAVNECQVITAAPGLEETRYGPLPHNVWS